MKRAHGTDPGHEWLKKSINKGSGSCGHQKREASCLVLHMITELTRVGAEVECREKPGISEKVVEGLE